MILCDTIKHHNKNEKPCALGFWHFMTSERIAGFSASLSAQSPVGRKIYRTFIFVRFQRLSSLDILTQHKGDKTKRIKVE